MQALVSAADLSSHWTNKGLTGRSSESSFGKTLTLKGRPTALTSSEQRFLANRTRQVLDPDAGIEWKPPSQRCAASPSSIGRRNSNAQSQFHGPSPVRSYLSDLSPPHLTMIVATNLGPNRCLFRRLWWLQVVHGRCSWDRPNGMSRIARIVDIGSVAVIAASTKRLAEAAPDTSGDWHMVRAAEFLPQQCPSTRAKAALRSLDQKAIGAPSHGLDMGQETCEHRLVD